jgi:type IV fimbrial biogenesis protein FimT
MYRISNLDAARRQTGLTLVESLIGLAVTTLVLGTAVPHLESASVRRHLDGTAAQLETDLHYLRSAAVAQNRSLRISFGTAAGASCYVVHSGSAGSCSCDASGTSTCTAGAEALRTVSFAADAPVGVQSNSASMLADATHGTVTPTGTVQVKARHGETLHVVVNILGRVRACAATPGLTGYAHC